MSDFVAFVASHIFFFLLPLFSSSLIVAKALPSFASVSLESLLPYTFFHPARILHASATDFGIESLRCSTSFSICSIYSPYFAFSDLYKNRIEWCYYFIHCFLNLAVVGGSIPVFFNIALASSSHLPNLSPSSSQTFLIAIYWFLESWISWNFSWYSVIRCMWAIALLWQMCWFLVSLVYINFLDDR